MADEKSWFDTAKEWIWGATKSVGGEVGSEMVAEYFFGGRGKGTPLRDQFTKLIEGGEDEKALSLLKASPYGFGAADEEIFGYDMLVVRRTLPQEEKNVLPNFLLKLTYDQLENFRLAHTLQTNEDMRRQKLIDLVREFKTDAQRLQHLKATQVLEPTTKQNIKKTLREIDAELASPLAASRVRVANRKEKLEQKWYKRLFD